MALLTKAQIKQIIVDGLEQIAPIQNDVGVDAIAESIFQAQNGAEGEIPDTTDDLPEGSTNLYFIEAPQDGKEYSRKNSSWVESSASGTTFDDTGLPTEITDLGFTTVQEVLAYLLTESTKYLELNT